MGCHDETIHIPMKEALTLALPNATEDERYAAVEAATTLAEQIRDRAVTDVTPRVEVDGPLVTYYVDARDIIIRKIFDADLVQGGRRYVRRAARLTIEEDDVLETIVPLNPSPRSM